MHYLLFNDLHHILIYFVGDIAFVFIEVLLVTLIIHSLLDRREKANIIGKMSTVIGAFFSELGRPLIVLLMKHGVREEALGVDLRFNNNWTDSDYRNGGQSIVRKRKYHSSLMRPTWRRSRSC